MKPLLFIFPLFFSLSSFSQDLSKDRFLGGDASIFFKSGELPSTATGILFFPETSIRIHLNPYFGKIRNEKWRLAFGLNYTFEYSKNFSIASGMLTAFKSLDHRMGFSVFARRLYSLGDKASFFVQPRIAVSYYHEQSFLNDNLSDTDHIFVGGIGFRPGFEYAFSDSFHLFIMIGQLSLNTGVDVSQNPNEWAFWGLGNASLASIAFGAEYYW